MGTSSRNKTTTKIKNILDKYSTDQNLEVSKKEKNIMCKEVIKEYMSGRKRAKGYFDPEKMTNLLSAGFGGFKKVQSYFEEIDDLSKDELEEDIKEYLEDNGDELITDGDEIYRSSYIKAMADAILSEKNKDDVFIQSLVVNVVKLGVFSEVKEEFLERANKEISLGHYKKEIEKCVEEYLKESMDKICQSVKKGEWKELSGAIKKVKKNLKGDKDV